MLEKLEDRTLLAAYIVDLTTDNGGKNGQSDGALSGDLRYCITSAAAGDTVGFAADIQAGTTIFLNPATGAIPINITQNDSNKTLTIDGGNLDISIDGGNKSRIFNIAGNLSNVAITNLTLQNGYAAADNPLGGNGGAINDTGGTLKLNNVYFSTNNAASSGGAVFTNDLRDTLSVIQCRFFGNYADDAGGAIYAGYENTPYNVTATNSSFDANTSGGNGGAISATTGAQSTLEADSCQFQQNSMTTSSNGEGGAIFTTDKLIVAATTANPSTFSQNSAGMNGGAIAWEPGVNSVLKFSNLTFSVNSALNNGGGVFANVGDTSDGPISLGAISETITGCTFSENDAGWNGGGLYVLQATAENGSAKMNLINSTFSHNTAEHGGGGGIAVSLTASNDPINNAVTLDSLTVSNRNSGTYGGGLWTDPTSNTTLSLKNSIIAGNELTTNAPLRGTDVFGTVKSLGNNLIGITDGGDTQWLDSDLTGTNAAPRAAGLDPNGLANNGGPTETIRLLARIAHRVYAK
jgi:predicted outer membrane repeat protein